MNLTAERFNAIEHKNGIVGCTMSHLQVLKMARDNNLPYILILEDDFTFLVLKEHLEKEIQYLIDYSNDIKNKPFDVCFLSYNIQKSLPISNNNHFIKIIESYTASGYIINNHYYNKLIELYELAIPKLEETGHHWIYANDQIWKKLQSNKDSNWIAFTTRLGKQRASYSDNSQIFANYNI